MKHSLFYGILAFECIVLSILIYLLSLQQVGTFTILFFGNIFLALLFFLSYTSTSQTITNSNPAKFINSVMKNTVLKFFLLVIAASVLIYTQKASIKKIDIFLLMGLYVLYSLLETIMLSKLAKKK